MFCLNTENVAHIHICTHRHFDLRIIRHFNRRLFLLSCCIAPDTEFSRSLEVCVAPPPPSLAEVWNHWDKYDISDSAILVDQMSCPFLSVSLSLSLSLSLSVCLSLCVLCVRTSGHWSSSRVARSFTGRARPSEGALVARPSRRRRCYPRLIDDHPPNTAHRQCFSSFETRNTGQYRDSGALFLHRSPISILIFVSRSVFLLRHRFKFPTASRSQTPLSKIVVAQNRTYTSQTFRVLAHCANVDWE